MYDEKRNLISSYRATPVTLGALLGDLSDRAAARRHDDTEWSISEVVCHLLDAEQREFERVGRIRDEERPALPVFPDDAYAGRSAGRTLSLFTRLRDEHARLLEELDPSAWSRIGIHETHGELSILDITRHIVAHDAEHIAQIARLHRLEASAPMPAS